MRRWIAIGGAGAGAAAVLVGILLWPAGPGPAPPPIRSAPAFRLADVRPGLPTVVLGGLPSRPVVVNFFAAWCDPCHAELPRIARMQREEAGRVDVLGVDVQDNRDLAQALLTAAGVAFPAAYDPNRTVSDAWGVDGLPVTVFVAAGGGIVDYHRGELSDTALDRLTRHLVGTGASPQHRQS